MSVGVLVTDLLCLLARGRRCEVKNSYLFLLFPRFRDVQGGWFGGLWCTDGKAEGMGFAVVFGSLDSCLVFVFEALYLVFSLGVEFEFKVLEVCLRFIHQGFLLGFEEGVGVCIELGDVGLRFGLEVGFNIQLTLHPGRVEDLLGVGNETVFDGFLVEHLNGCLVESWTNRVNPLLNTRVESDFVCQGLKVGVFGCDAGDEFGL